ELAAAELGDGLARRRDGRVVVVHGTGPFRLRTWVGGGLVQARTSARRHAGPHRERPPRRDGRGRGRLRCPGRSRCRSTRETTGGPQRRGARRGLPLPRRLARRSGRERLGGAWLEDGLVERGLIPRAGAVTVGRDEVGFSRGRLLGGPRTAVSGAALGGPPAAPGRCRAFEPDPFRGG